MKKSIAILSMHTVMLVFRQCHHGNIHTSPKSEYDQKEIKRISENSSGTMLWMLETAEDQDPPWKDPWQWRDIIRRVWKFWRH